MLAIRLSRTGKTHQPHYRIVVQEKRSKLNGKAIEIIGHYHPAQAGKLLVIDKEKAKKWLDQGAQPSDTVTNLLVKEGVLDKSRTVHNFFTPKAKEEVKEEPKAEVAETTEEATDSEIFEETVKTAEGTPEEALTEEAPATEETAE